jgi:hypothetical protein
MIDKVFRGAGVGVAVGVTLIVFGPALLRAARPLARQAIKTAIVGYEQGREALAHIQEMVEDAYAEAMSELTAESAQAETEAAGDSLPAVKDKLNG